MEQLEKKGWRRYIPSWKIVVGVLGLGFVAFLTLIGVAYAKTPVPKAGNEDAMKTAAIFYYSDGKTEIARQGKNRELIKVDQVPKHVQEAVIAAENRSFRTDPGFSVKGISRAVWNNLSGGDTQGGSTITQQLAKNYYLTDERSMSRKFKELFISVKLGQEKEKDQILELYLNTIYFGRNSYGIQAASKTFFGVPVDKLKPDQGALLAAIIQQPGRYDPRSEEYKQETLVRYQYVLDGMVKTNALSQVEADKYKTKLPQTKPIGGNVFKGDKGYMVKRAIKELERDQKIPEKAVIDQGLHVVTTFDRGKMAAAKRAVEGTIPQTKPRRLPKHVQLGLVSVNPANGEVEGFYGGQDYVKHQFDNVWAGSAQAGSAMKPYVLATALKEGYSLKTLVEGRSRSAFDSNGNVVARGTPGAYSVPNSHSGGPAVDLVRATRDSINTAYVQLGLKVGLNDVIKTAEDSGISPDLLEPHKNAAGLSLGINDIRPVEQAAGYATFASGGVYHKPHVVKKVMKNDNKTVYKELKWPKRTVFSKDVAADATFAMQSVVKGGTGKAAALADRQVAGKTGTTDKNVATWFNGYIPQMSTAVTMYNDKKKSLILPGLGEVQGGTIPAKIWHTYMTQVTRGMAPQPFPPPANIGNQQQWAKPPPTTRSAEPDRDRDRDRPKCNKPWDRWRPECQSQSPSPSPGDLPPCTTYPPDTSRCDPSKEPPPGTQAHDQWCQMPQNESKPSCRDEEPGPEWPPRPEPRTQFQTRSPFD